MKKYSFKNSIDTGILVLVAILPFLPILSIQIPINIAGYSLIGFSREIICIFLIIISLLNLIKKRKIKLDIYTIIIGIYILYGIFHIFISRIGLGLGIDKFRLMYLYPITFICVYMSGYKVDKEFLYKLRKVILAQFIIMSCFAILEIIFREKLLILLYKDKYYKMHLNLLGKTNIRTVSLLENPINLALFMNISLVVLLCRKTKFKFLDVVFIFINIIITLTTLSRTSYIIMGAIIIFYIITNRQILKKILKLLIPITIIAVIITSYSAISTNKENSEGVISSRLKQLSIENILNNDRVDNWKTYLDNVFNGDPYLYLWGSGLGSSNPSNEYQSDIVKKVENAYISILGETGIVGLSIYIVIISIFIYRAAVIYNNNILLSKILIGCMLVLLIGSLANDLHQNNPFSMYLWLSIFISILYKPYKIT